MKIVILDAQGGGMGRQLVEGLKKALPNQPLIAVGTNALATAAMLRAGADQVATGENSVVVCAGMADLILCPIGMVLCDAMLGEVTANMALAGGEYAIPCDEVIDAMGRVGSLLSPDLRETGQGGLAATPTGVKIAQRLAQEG